MKCEASEAGEPSIGRQFAIVPSNGEREHRVSVSQRPVGGMGRLRARAAISTAFQLVSAAVEDAGSSIESRASP